MDLVRDLLDKQIVDRSRRNMGRVDGIVLEVEAGRPPRATRIEVGPTVLARRLHPVWGRWMELLARWWGEAFGEPVRIPLRRIRSFGVEIEIDLDAEACGAMRWERWLSTHIVAKIPGAER